MKNDFRTSQAYFKKTFITNAAKLTLQELLLDNSDLSNQEIKQELEQMGVDTASFLKNMQNIRKKKSVPKSHGE